MVCRIGIIGLNWFKDDSEKPDIPDAASCRNPLVLNPENSVSPGILDSESGPQIWV
jgi:hypothetical protein